MEKVSIILTSYNKGKFLKECIESILLQDHKNFELIIVDDASTDASQKIINKFSSEDKRIKYFFRKQNSGTAAVPRNTGIKLSKSKYICFVDADDKWNKNKLSSQLKLIGKNLFSFTACDYIDQNGKKHSNIFIDIVRLFFQKFFVSKGLAGLFVYNPIILSSVIIKRKVVDKYKFNESKSIVGVEDLDLWLKILNDYPKKFNFISKKLTIVRKIPNSLNRNYTQASLRNSFCVIKFFLEKKNFKKIDLFLFGFFLRSLKSLFLSSKEVIKKKFKVLVSVLVIFYVIIFFSPLFWYTGKYLVSYDYEKKLSKNLVIMSGNGDTNYINTGYQKRYLDARHFLETNRIKKIFIIGRNQEIEESKILKSLFIMDGFNKNDIVLISQKFRNTKENINEVESVIKNYNISEINFLTSPYHSKRSKLLWKKQAKDIKVNILYNIHNPVSKIRYTYKLKEIKIILYEWAALLYNKLRGWI